MPIVHKDISEQQTAGTAPDSSLAFLIDVKLGLGQKRKKIPPKYLYDQKGSEIFRQITHLEEYYLYICERELLHNNKKKILSNMGDTFNLIDLGAGDGTKTMILLEQALALKKDVTYVPVDISQDSNQTLGSIIQEKLPQLKCTLLTGLYQNGIRYINSNLSSDNLIVFMGSNIGNFNREAAEEFLMGLYQAMKSNDRLMIMFDLRKDYKTIQKAYDDSKGISSTFEFNILHRINAELGGNFQFDKFFFHCYFDSYQGCIKNFLVSKTQQDVHIKLAHRNFHFEEYEAILVEECHKYTSKEISTLTNKCGFKTIENYYDEKKYVVHTLLKKP